jgi:hypothetical protein
VAAPSSSKTEIQAGDDFHSTQHRSIPIRVMVWANRKPRNSSWGAADETKVLRIIL